MAFPLLDSSAAPNPQPSIVQAHENLPHLITINIPAQAPLKLTLNNYPAWHTQFNTLLIRYNLLGFFNSTNPYPPKTLTTITSSVPNLAFHIWIHHDQLLLNAIFGFISLTFIYLSITACTSNVAGTTLHSTYTKQSNFG